MDVLLMSEHVDDIHIVELLTASYRREIKPLRNSRHIPLRDS